MGRGETSPETCGKRSTGLGFENRRHRGRAEMMVTSLGALARPEKGGGVVEAMADDDVVDGARGNSRRGQGLTRNWHGKKEGRTEISLCCSERPDDELGR
jgi:hypothetical protein